MAIDNDLDDLANDTRIHYRSMNVAELRENKNELMSEIRSSLLMVGDALSRMEIDNVSEDELHNFAGASENYNFWMGNADFFNKKIPSYALDLTNIDTLYSAFFSEFTSRLSGPEMFERYKTIVKGYNQTDVVSHELIQELKHKDIFYSMMRGSRGMPLITEGAIHEERHCEEYCFYGMETHLDKMRNMIDREDGVKDYLKSMGLKRDVLGRNVLATDFLSHATNFRIYRQMLCSSYHKDTDGLDSMLDKLEKNDFYFYRSRLAFTAEFSDSKEVSEMTINEYSTMKAATSIAEGSTVVGFLDRLEKDMKDKFVLYRQEVRSLNRDSEYIEMHGYDYNL
ncbi:MAG: hypothetical protein ACI83O_000254 [Patescibacteria group bacterium]|jgi:hypothetical protein